MHVCVCACSVCPSRVGCLVCRGRGAARCWPSIADLHSDAYNTSPPLTPTPPSTAQILTQALSNYPKQLKAAHINAESLRGHLDEIREIFQPKLFDIISISESWLKPSIKSHEVALPGYMLFRNDRIKKNCGGVAVYVREGIKAKLLYSTPSEYSARPEFMFLEICLSGSDVLLLGVCYRPPKLGYLTDFENILLRLLPGYGRVLIMGDFNTDLMKKHKFDYVQLTTMFESCNMTILPLEPTHHTADSHTLIDLMVVSDPSDIVHHGQLPIPAISRHDLIYCVFSVRSPKPKSKLIKYRDFKNMDELTFMADVNKLPWHNIQELISVDDMVDLFNTMISDVYDRHVPVVTKRITKNHPVPWMTKDILSLMARRDYVYRKARKSGDPAGMDLYRQLRNRVKQLLRNSRLRYTHNLFTNKQSSSDMWRNIKSLGLGKQQVSLPVLIPLNDLNNFFISSSQTLNQSSVNDHAAELLSNTNNDLLNLGFYFKPVVASDVLKVVRHIRSNAVGSDDIPISFVKRILFAVLPALTHIYNTSLRSGVFPSQWKSALIRPLNKTHAPKTCQDYRPISILPAISKGLERIVHHQITEFLENNNLFNICQSGFRPKHSTETALLRITDDIRLAMDKRQGTILTLFDFSKAFDCVSHKLLIAKLRAIGFSSKVITWVGSYLADRRQCVRVDGESSNWENVTCGVPQGSILGPLLYVLYVNDISTSLRYCNFHMYADDLQIYSHFTPANVNDAVERMNSDIANIVQWTERHGLKLNPTKTQPIVICYSRLMNSIDMNSIPLIRVDGTELTYCNKVKSLGLTLNNTLSWSDAVVETCNKVFASVHTLKRLQRFLPLHIKLLLVKTLIFPYFAYCSSVINDMTVVLGEKLQRSQNYCLRFAYDVKRDEHITPFYIRSKILKLSESRNVKILSILYSIIKSGFPKYFLQDFQFISEQSARNSRSGTSVMRMPQHRTVIYAKSFTVTACRLWNSLPADIKSVDGRSRFVASLKKFYLERMSAAEAT